MVLRWGRTVDGEREPSHGLPAKILESLATLAVVAAEPWAASTRTAWPHPVAFYFGAERSLTRRMFGQAICLRVWMGLGTPGGGGLVHLCPSWGLGLSIRPRAGTRVNKQLSCTRWQRLCCGTPGPRLGHYL